VEFFEKQIRPVLVDSCYKCHSKDAEKIKGGLLLDTRDGLLKGGDTGPALVPGDPEKSLLVKAIRYTDENLQMPPKGKKLPAAQVADFEPGSKWGPRIRVTMAPVENPKPKSSPLKRGNIGPSSPLACRSSRPFKTSAGPKTPSTISSSLGWKLAA